MTTRLESSCPVPDRADRGGSRTTKESLGADLGASLVVFLVALPLSVGIAVASGVPVELGIVTSVIGGLVVGLLPGSTMQVSGPAAGLTVLVASIVAEHGPGMLGVIVLGAGLLQVLMGVARIGAWFRAISPSVVHGMLAGIGLVLILGQLYPAAGLAQPTSTSQKFAELPELLTTMVTTPVGLSGVLVTVLTLLIVVGWPWMPPRVRTVPGPLVAVAAGSAVALVLDLPLSTIEVGSLLSGLGVPELGAFTGLTSPAVLGSILSLALVASAASLFTAAAVDRMHEGPKTHYNRELLAQGAGNTICGLLGALPMTAVIVRSSTNVRAGACTKLARVLHGAWMLLFVVLLPWILSYIPAAVLAAVLLHAGWKLLSVGEVVRLAREHRSEALVVVATAVVIVNTGLLLGTLTGLALAIGKSAWEVSRLSIESEHSDDHVHVSLGGNATFLRLPQLLDHLEQLPLTRSAHLDLSALRHLDRACHQAVDNWVAQRRRNDCSVEVAMPAAR